MESNLGEWNLGESKPGQWSTDRVEQELVRFESVVGSARAAQMALLSELDRRQVTIGDGCRSLHEWTASRLDLSPENAKVLVNTSRRLADLPYLSEKLSTGEVSFDRLAEVAKVASPGKELATLEWSLGWDLSGLRHQLSLRTRLERRAEQWICSERLAIQVNLDQTAYRLWGELPGEAGGIVSSALSTRGESFPPLPDGTRGTLGQRNADVLTSICTDSLTGGSGENGGGSQPLLTVTLDGSHLSSDGEPGETGLSVLSGPRVGPETLDVLLCTGKVEINLVTSDGRLLGVGEAFSYLSPRLRRHVLARDGGCTVDGCQSRYRLEAHHVITRREGGNHHPGNLATSVGSTITWSSTGWGIGSTRIAPPTGGGFSNPTVHRDRIRRNRQASA